VPTWRQLCGLTRVIFNFLKADDVDYMLAVREVRSTGKNDFAIPPHLAASRYLFEVVLSQKERASCDN